jgi:hypothetical protein
MLFESMFYDMFMGIAGNPFIVGITTFLILIAFIVVLKIGPEAGAVILIPTFILVGLFIPQVAILMVIAVGVIFGLALIKITR